MYMKENILLALEGLRSNKMRALLTMLGIIIGIGSVIAIVTVGDSMTSSVSSSMQSFGVTNIMITLQSKDSEDSGPMGMLANSTMSEIDLISDDMLDKYKELYGDNIEAISLSASGGAGKVRDGRRYANISTLGVNDGYGIANNIDMIKGRFLREGDIKSNRYVAVVSDKLVKNIFGADTDPLGQEMKVSTDDTIQTYTIVGVYKHEQSMMGAMTPVADKDVRTEMYIPISTCNMLTSADKGYRSVIVMATATTDARKFARDSRDFFNTYYSSNSRYEISSISMESMMSTVTTMMGTLSIAVAVIAGISLVVGGVGVMNIMLVSVTERTREIGTRKALGARNSSVRAQFIVEAVIICGIGGVIGIITGVSFGYLGSYLLGFPGFPTTFIIIIAVLFSMMIGVFFGYYPADKAARLDPIEALRYE